MIHRPHLLWITDPWETLDHPKDTTLRLIEECITLGIDTSWCDVRSIRLEGGEVLLDARKIEGVFPGRSSTAFRMSEPVATQPIYYTRTVYRTDPPVDLAYLHPLQLLALAYDGIKASQSQLVNPIPALLTANEKFEGALLGGLMPPTLIATEWARHVKFGETEGKTVLKPLHNAQGKGVELLSWKDVDSQHHARSVLEIATQGFTRPICLQRYLDGIKDGEQRLWFLNGRLLAAARKKPKAGEFKIDMDAGGTLVPTELNSFEKRAATAIGKRLRARRIRMAAVDLIDGFVTDFNFTSPGLLTPMEVLLGANLAKPVVESLIHPWK